MEITQEKLAELKELAQKATPESWNCIYRFDEWENYVGPEKWADMGRSVCICRYGKDAAYIAVANPATTLALIAEIARLEREADRLARYLADSAVEGRYDDAVAYWRETARKAVEEEHPDEE